MSPTIIVNRLGASVFPPATVTTNPLALLAIPFTCTCAIPLNAPAATTAVICVGVHPVTTPLMLPSINVPCVLPNPVPTIVTVAPTVAADGLTLVIVGTSTVNAPPDAITHPTSTRALPEAAPAPTFATIEPSFQVCTTAATVPSHTCPVPCVAPNPGPVIVTCVPGTP